MEILVRYRRTRRLSMRIGKNGDVHVSAPIGMPGKEVERFIEQHRDWITEARRKTAERTTQRDRFYNQLLLTTKAQKLEACNRVRALVEPMVAQHAAAMGVKPTAVSFKPMISRWGVCHVARHSICYSTYLLLLPEWCVEHVVVHELCHIRHHDHSPAFYALLASVLPDHRERRKLLRMPREE